MATGEPDPRVLRVVAASPQLLEFALVYEEWLVHVELCDHGCAFVGAAVLCERGDGLIRAVNTLHRLALQAALAPLLDDDDGGEEPGALVGQPWRAPVEVGP